MTYCCGILVREGLVIFADTRTNAGVDNIATFRKLHVFTDPGKRIMAIASAGNLSISQSVVSILTEGYDNPETGERETLMNSPSMFQAAQRVGEVIRTLKAKGFTILLVEQNFRFAATVADRYYVMEHGRIVDHFSNAQLANNMEKLHDYLGV